MTEALFDPQRANDGEQFRQEMAQFAREARQENAGMIFFVVGLPILWRIPRWWLWAVLCLTHATVSILLIGSFEDFYRELASQYPFTSGRWEAMWGSIPINLGAFAAAGAAVVAFRKTSLAKKRLASNVAPPQQIDPLGVTHLDPGILTKKWVLWACLGMLVCVILGYLVERGGYGSLPGWLSDSFESENFSPLFWAAAGFAIGAIGSALAERPKA